MVPSLWNNNPPTRNRNRAIIFISSLDPDVVSASAFQGSILGHWEIENCLHGQKDKEYGEDEHVCASPWGEAWTVLTNMAVSLTNLLQKGGANTA